MAQEAGLERQPIVSDSVVDRSIEDIRQDIERTRQNISGTVDSLGTKLHEQLDWREYVRRKPFVAIGVGVGAGLLLSRMIVPRPQPRASISDLISNTLAKTVLQITRPRESFAAGAFKMLAGVVATQIAQSQQPGQESEEHYSQAGGSAVRG